MIRSKRVLICGFYGHQNVGDEAMLAGMLHILRETSDEISVTVFSNDPENTSKSFGVESIYYNNFPRGFWWQLRQAIKIIGHDIFLLGGGDLFRDSLDKSIAQDWLRPLRQAQLLGRKTGVIGVSVGDVWRKETAAQIVKTLNQTNFIGVRDNQSKHKLRRMGITQNVYVMSDLSLYVSPTYTKCKPVPSRTISVGFSVRGLVARSNSMQEESCTQLYKELAAVADFLAENYDASVHFLPLRSYKNSYHSHDDDYVSCLRVLQYARNSSSFIVHRNFEGPDDLLSVISSLNLVIGMRLHSLILTTGSGIPVIGIEYDTKVKAYMEEIGQQRYSMPIEFFRANEVIDKIQEIFGSHDKTALEIQKNVSIYRYRNHSTDAEIRKFLESA